MDQQPRYDIAILLPTRGRSEMLERSIRSLIELADDPGKVQLMFGFDNDDDVGTKAFMTELRPWLDEKQVQYRALTFQPLGYIRLNEYVNELARKSDARWLVFWNDDAVMETQGWDTEIMKWDGKFRLLAFHTHRDHPYSIFPIVPRAWLDLLGYLSPHQISDAWLSQQAYMLDIWQRIPVDVLHDRHDLTGNNDDETFRNRPMLEGNPRDPRDFHSLAQMDKRHRDAYVIRDYLESELGYDMTFFDRIFTGEQDPWERLAANDVNRQMVQFKNPHTHFAAQAQLQAQGRKADHESNA
jgi:hypothetical protein